MPKIIDNGAVYVIEGHGPQLVATEAHSLFDLSFLAFCESPDGHWDGESPITIRKASRRELEVFAKGCSATADNNWVLL